MSKAEQMPEQARQQLMVTSNELKAKLSFANNSDRLQRASKAGTLPYFVRDNYNVGKDGTLTPTFASKAPTPYKGTFKGLPKEKNATQQQAPSNFKDIRNKLREATKPFEHNLYGTFEPFSPMIIEAVRMAKDRKTKNAIFERILNDKRASVLYQTQTAKTTIFPNHKGKKSKYWRETQGMAKALNEDGISVSFLSELDAESCADTILKLGKKRWAIADFKYSTSTNYNTIAEDIIAGTSQASTIVLQVARADRGVINKAFEQVKRKRQIPRRIILINKYGDVVSLTRADILKNNGRNKLKGFL